MAVAGLQALLLFGHRLGQAVRGQQQVALVALVRPAQRRAVGARHLRDVPREAVGQLLQRRRAADQRAHVVQRLQPLALVVQLGGLLRHLGFQVAVHRLQVLGQVVEAGSERAELVAAARRDARAEVAVLQPFDALLERRHRLEHEAVAAEQQRRTTGQRQCQHRRLQQVLQRGPARHVQLDGVDQRVDLCDEGRRLLAQPGRLHDAAAVPLLPQRGPAGFDGGEALFDRGVPGHEQRPLGVAGAQQLQAVLEVRQLQLLAGRVGGGQ